MIIQMFLSRTLSIEGYNITGEERNCKGAIESIKIDKPDLVLLDIGIVGDKDGVETAQLINNEYQIPVIFITGNSDKSTLERARKTNPIDFIFKPIDEDKLKNRLRELNQ